MDLITKLFDRYKRNRPHVGFRIIKTVTAVFLCALAGELHDQPVYFSMIAAVICMQNTTGETLEAAFNQVIGTVIGGVFGVALLYLELLIGLERFMPLYYLVCSLFLIPVILTTLIIKKSSASALACIVFLSIAVFRLGTAYPWLYALQRVIDIIIGVAAAFLINIILPNRPEDERETSAPE
ncbi:MAG: FUSC family protein [Oscillospiraceae bacterium]|nr:FUSC family protein [Oscillospiraceae bacterium]